MAKPTMTIEHVPADRVDEITEEQLEGGAESVTPTPEGDSGLFTLLVTWPEGTILD